MNFWCWGSPSHLLLQTPPTRGGEKSKSHVAERILIAGRKMYGRVVEKKGEGTGGKNNRSKSTKKTHQGEG